MHRSLLAVCVTLLAGPIALAGFREGPLPAMTGGFGEQNCRSCHFDNPPNEEGGTLRLEGLPDEYASGKDYAVTVTIRRTEMKRGGFEMAARFAAGALKGQQAGRWRGIEGRTQIVTAPANEIQYVQHTKSGSDLTSAGENRWTFTWTAPENPAAPVVFHAAGNAANDDASPLGDYIYTAAITARPVRQ